MAPANLRYINVLNNSNNNNNPVPVSFGLVSTSGRLVASHPVPVSVGGPASVVDQRAERGDNDG